MLCYWDVISFLNFACIQEDMKFLLSHTLLKWFLSQNVLVLFQKVNFQQGASFFCSQIYFWLPSHWTSFELSVWTNLEYCLAHNGQVPCTDFLYGLRCHEVVHDRESHNLPSSQPTHDVPRTSPQGPLKVITSRAYRGPSGDQYKNWWFNEKVIF